MLDKPGMEAEEKQVASFQPKQPGGPNFKKSFGMDNVIANLRKLGAKATAFKEFDPPTEDGSES